MEGYRVSCRVDCANNVDIARPLIKFTLRDKLTHLNIAFYDFTMQDEDDWESDEITGRDKLQELIQNVHSALSLEHVTFSKTAIRLIDVENLHSSLSNSKSWSWIKSL